MTQHVEQNTSNDTFPPTNKPEAGEYHQTFMSAKIAFDGVCATLIALALVMIEVPAFAQSSNVIFEDWGKIVGVDGQECQFVRYHSSHPQEIEAMMRGQFKLPGYADQATVFLNGWHLSYLHDDHHVQTIEARIGDVHVGRDGVLRWRARGDLGDKGDDDNFKFCYTYTVLAWSRASIDAIAHNKGDIRGIEFGTRDTVMRTGGEVADPAFAGKSAAAVLLRGLSVGYMDAPRVFPWACFDCPTDHHVLQEAYVLDQPRAAPYGDGHVLWDATGIVKDNAAHRQTFFFTSVAAIAGNDVSVHRRSLVITPKNKVGFGVGCIVASGPRGVRTRQFEISGLPYDYAMPMLTGWDLFYPCKDHHVAEIGAWIHDVTYKKVQGGGQLRYKLSTVLRDKGQRSGLRFALQDRCPRPQCWRSLRAVAETNPDTGLRAAIVR